MNPIMNNLLSNLALNQQSSLQSDPLASRFTQASLSNQKSTDISIITAEGDRVTLSMNTSQQISYSSYNQYGEVTGSSHSFQMNQFSLELSKEFSISVEGTLSKDELLDIQKILKKIDKIARSFFQGDMEKALKASLKMASSDLGSIQSLEVNLMLSTSSAFNQISQFKPIEVATTAHQEDQSNNGGLISLDQIKDLIKDILKESREVIGISKQTEKGVKEFIKDLFHEIKKSYSDKPEKGRLAEIINAEILNQL